METLRQTTKLTRISDITDSKFIRKEGMEPSYVLTKFGEKISRAKIVGTVVEKFMSEDGNYSSVTIDDDTDGIRVKAFKEDADFFEKVNVGENVFLIGKVREYNGENYIIPEIIRKASNNYEAYHKLKVLKELVQKKKIYERVQKNKDKFADFEELKKFMIKKYGYAEKEIDGMIETLGEKEKKKEHDHKPMLMELIEKLDKGKGIEIKRLLEESKIDENSFKEAVGELLSDGIWYEPKPGVVKKV
ncbi:MAG: hypothetical protein COY38_00205 [Candidatus Aenigmarchaeota archaeon CG_4_10_14_0_8_um_filter_37_24]|nr:hypothetical protein [Candidatus Aenigmarchaeota archaeon]OIN86133.1 MAG: hypothetical protein AUJ50_04265 [Candidatus Aenigmarchaeota archaeon CG1_02_38_14]PIW41771.1 MAG: hypothetical protein COW21_00155 [Candidatus Aenigmarchaeota archaeon CG15_BIG_FIL_POST_REV_8_21_14_020_37_27]PIX50452.1 MAG: hypothetical protein COZ52_04045 [Candidatus Aenigmarchaeota archaeon CG_4_8_14_3_um_filter_37_24]PIY35296.1 MAG: hypothetical protein COZ04_03995 [Candidatus Aenigmarchaeota archaeon CG_4_10_14_3_